MARIFPDAGYYARVADATGFPVGPLETVFRLADSLAAVDRVSTAAWRSEVVSLARRPLLVQLQEARKTARGHLERVASLEDAHLRFLRHLDRGHIAGHGHPLPSGSARSASGSTSGGKADMARRVRRGGVVLRGKIRNPGESLSSLRQPSLRTAVRDPTVKESLSSLSALPRAGAAGVAAAARAAAGRTRRERYRPCTLRAPHSWFTGA